MSGPINYDSMSRCEDPNSLYSVIQHPNARKSVPSQSTSAITKDTIVSTQQQINREVLNRFKITGLNFSHDSYVAVAQIGKYIFLAIMLPPYLCMYGIPRWLIASAIPQLFTFVKTELVQIGKHVQTLSAHIKDLMKGILQQMLGDAMRIMNQQSRNLWQQLSAVRNALLSPLVRLEEGVTAFVGKLQKEVEKIFHAVEKKITSQVNHVVKVVVEQVVAANQLINQMLINPTINLLTPPALYLSEWFTARTKTLSRHIQNASKRIQRSAKSVSGVLTSYVKEVVDVFVPIFPPIALRARKIYDFALSGFARRSSKAKKRVVTVARVAYRLVEKMMSVGKSLLLRIFKILQPFIIVGRWLGRQLLRLMRKSLKSQESKIRYVQRIVRGVSTFAMRQFKKVALTCVSAVNRLKQGATYLFVRLKRFLAWLCKQSILLPSKVKYALLRVGRLIRQIASYILLAMRLSLAVVVALFTLAILSLRHITSREAV